MRHGFDPMATLALPKQLQETEVRLKAEYCALHDDSKDAVDLLF